MIGESALSEFPDLRAALSDVPAGRWIVGVSGGADSVALLTALLHFRSDVSVVAAHLDHEWRGAASADDAAFVASLAARLGVPCEIATRSAWALRRAQRNREAAGRSARQAFFVDVAGRHDAAGVLLAHHADDQSETVFLRLVRGGNERTLLGMSRVANLSGLPLLRPLLGVRRERLRAWLRAIAQPFCDDESNRSMMMSRNRVRVVLQRDERLSNAMRRVGEAARAYCELIDAAAPTLAVSFDIAALSRLPLPLAEASALRWLTCVARCPIASLDRKTVQRLIEMTRDAATAARQHFPSGVEVCRRAGVISVLPRGATRQPCRDTPRPSPAI